MKNSSSVPLSLFDRIFKPEQITLENGHTVLRPRSRTPLIIICIVLVLYFSVIMTGFNPAIILKRGGQLTKFSDRFFSRTPVTSPKSGPRCLKPSK